MRFLILLFTFAFTLLTGCVANAEPPVNPDAQKVKELLKLRQKVVTDELKLIRAREDIVTDVGQWLWQLCETHEHLLEVNLELSETPGERITAYKKTLDELNKLEEQFVRTVVSKLLPQDDRHLVEIRLKIEINMTKEQIKQNAK